MKETIYTIPVNEVFEPKDGCPLCRLRDILEERSLEYIMGAAMMELDVRTESNKTGFCQTHYLGMLARRNRLSLTLILESHLAEQKKNLAAANAAYGKKKAANTGLDRCFVCEQIDWALTRMIETVCKSWAKEEDFRKLYAEQPYICLTHYHALASRAGKFLGRKELAPFLNETLRLTEKKLDDVAADVSAFCKLFDYRSVGSKPTPEVAAAAERAIHYITSRDPQIEK